jgi:para-nitrobenzyl esterase
MEIPFVFRNIAIAGPLISKMPTAYALADKTSAAWAAFARTGNPNTPGVPHWPAYSNATRDTMLFNDQLRVEQDPDRGLVRSWKRFSRWHSVSTRFAR